MTPDPADRSQSALSRSVSVLRRRMWLVVIPVVVAILVSVVADLVRPAEYEASSGVLLNRQSIAAAATDTQDPNSFGDFQRVVDTQAELARSPEVAQLVIRSLKLPYRTVDPLIARVTIIPEQSSDILTFRARGTTSRSAVALANGYAKGFSDYRLKLDTQVLQRAREDLARRIRELRSEGDTDRGVLNPVIASEQQLQTLESLQGANTTLARSASDADRLRPDVPRAAIIGLFAGLLVGILVAFARESLDTRIRDVAVLASELDAPMLGALAAPIQDTRSEPHIEMVTAPSSPQAEAFRVLRTNVDFQMLVHPAHVILLTSALAAEGKSTTVANLAVAYALAGRRVAVVDLDLRRPTLHRLFGVEQRDGLDRVIRGDASVASVLKTIDLDAEGGTLDILTTGATPPNPGEFVTLPQISKALDELRSTHDLVLVDSPPMLQAGDALVLSRHVDGLILLARLSGAKRGIVRELRQAVAPLPTPVLGVVVTGADTQAGYYYSGYASVPTAAG